MAGARAESGGRKEVAPSGGTAGLALAAVVLQAARLMSATPQTTWRCRALEPSTKELKRQ